MWWVKIAGQLPKGLVMLHCCCSYQTPSEGWVRGGIPRTDSLVVSICRFGKGLIFTFLLQLK